MTIPQIRACLALALTLSATSLSAQETRREAIEGQRAERASSLEVYAPGRLERALLYIERNRIIERLSGTDGLYPRVGSVRRGGGFAFGAGYRKPFASRHLVFNADAAMTTKGYRSVGTDVSAPRLLSERLTLTGRARYRYFPQEDYFGLGPESLKGDRVNFLLEESEFAGIAALKPMPWLTWSAKVARLDPRIAAGTDPLHPPIRAVFDDTTAPGLDRQPAFLETGTLLELDSRDQPGNPRSGTYVSLLGARYNDLDDFGYDFSRVGGEIQQYFPIFDKKRVIVMRGAFNRYRPDAGSAVPFYYTLPLGGKDSIRGFADFRFRDLEAVLFNVEYRWEAFAGLDMALFYDLGDVARRWSDFTLAGMKQSWGLGLRFNTYRSVFLRTEVAFGSKEGTRIYFAFGGPLRLERYLR
jgi:outer membrane protein assembly factor BamA